MRSPACLAGDCRLVPVRWHQQLASPPTPWRPRMLACARIPAPPTQPPWRHSVEGHRATCSAGVPRQPPARQAGERRYRPRAAAAAAERRLPELEVNRRWAGLLLVSPALAVIAVFFIVPLGLSVHS